MIEFVLDCSVTMSWCFPDEGDPYALLVREALRRSRGHAPSIWRLETANALLVAERKGRLTEADTTEFARIFALLRVAVDDQVPETWAQAVIALGRAHGLSAYDAAYLELAVRLHLPIATLDERLKVAALNSGVPIFAPQQSG